MSNLWQYIVLTLLVTACATNRVAAPNRAPAPPAAAYASRGSSSPASPPHVKEQQTPPPQSTACTQPVQHARLRGKLDRAVVKTAQEQLDLPMGSGRYVSVRSKRYLFCLEPHYHEPGSARGPVGWHKGVTVYEAT